MKNYIDTSRQKTPWDKIDQITPTQFFIKQKYKENYINKHPKLIDTNEADLFNSVRIDSCPYCKKTNYTKAGMTKNKIQRYYCKDCSKYFTPTTGTIFENHKISVTEWVEFCLNILNYGSITLISKVNKNGVNTSVYWLHKLFLLLQEYQNDIILSGKVYIDESYNSNQLKKLRDKDNPLDMINNQCDLLKKFLYSHSGFDRDDLQNYLNFFLFYE